NGLGRFYGGEIIALTFQQHYIDVNSFWRLKILSDSLERGRNDARPGVRPQPLRGPPPRCCSFKAVNTRLAPYVHQTFTLRLCINDPLSPFLTLNEGCSEKLDD